jgi:hypothetical protein
MTTNLAILKLKPLFTTTEEDQEIDKGKVVPVHN